MTGQMQEIDRQRIEIAGIWCEHLLKLADAFERAGRAQDALQSRTNAEHESALAFAMARRAVQP